MFWKTKIKRKSWPEWSAARQKRSLRSSSAKFREADGITDRPNSAPAEEAEIKRTNRGVDEEGRRSRSGPAAETRGMDALPGRRAGARRCAPTRVRRAAQSGDRGPVVRAPSVVRRLSLLGRSTAIRRRYAVGVAAPAEGTIEACISSANCCAVSRPVQSPPWDSMRRLSVLFVSGRSYQTMTS